MKYLLMICCEDGFVGDEQVGADTDAWVAETTRRGVRLSGSRLAPVGEAATVRLRDGRRVVTDGPFAETKEQMAGYDLIECDTRDEALEIAAAHPMARLGMIEVRPFWTG
ncbi:MAG TPA: YciI family protein [Pseudonocardia sp.]